MLLLTLRYTGTTAGTSGKAKVRCTGDTSKKPKETHIGKAKMEKKEKNNERKGKIRMPIQHVIIAFYPFTVINLC